MQRKPRYCKKRERFCGENIGNVFESRQPLQVTSLEFLTTLFDSSYLTGPYGHFIKHHIDLIKPISHLNWPQNDYIWLHSDLIGLHSDLIWLPVTSLGSLGGLSITSSDPLVTLLHSKVNSVGHKVTSLGSQVKSLGPYVMS